MDLNKYRRIDMDKPEARYLGDGVYADFDGYQIWVRTTERGHNRFENNIALEQEVLLNLNTYWKDIVKFYQTKDDGVNYESSEKNE